ncbi:MAG: agmatinase [Myxococcales bacterium]|nr:MAG: agmatinase [Myxococcales bacterium]
MPARYAVHPFLAARTAPERGAFALFGAPYDGTASFRSGSREGPEAIRRASEVLEDYCPVADRSLAETAFADLGDLELPLGDSAKVLECIAAQAHELFAAGVRPFLLGGEHLVSLPAILLAAERYRDLCLVQLDAHADLREDYLGVPYSHATVMRRAVERITPEKLFQFGVRSGTREEWAFMRQHGTARPATLEAAKAAAKAIGDRPVYLTLDLDVLDPSVLPGTGTPEPGGISFAELDAILRVFAPCNVVAADAVELAPGLDPSGASAVVAAKAVRTMLVSY